MALSLRTKSRWPYAAWTRSQPSVIGQQKLAAPQPARLAQPQAIERNADNRRTVARHAMFREHRRDMRVMVLNEVEGQAPTLG